MTKIKKVFKYGKGKKIAICAMRAMMHVSNLGRHRGYAEPSGVTGIAFFIPVLKVEKSVKFKVGGAAEKKMCEKETKKNLRKVVQVPKK